MDSRDEELTLENVDEQVARVLERLQTPQHLVEPSLERAVRNLQVIYEEKRRVERVWERLNSRVPMLDLPIALETHAEDDTATSQPLRLPGKAERDGNGLLEEHVHTAHRRPVLGRQPRRLRQRRNLGLGLVAALVLITLFAISRHFPALPRLRHHRLRCWPIVCSLHCFNIGRRPA